MPPYTQKTVSKAGNVVLYGSFSGGLKKPMLSGGVVTSSNLHYTIIKRIIGHRFAPDVNDLSKTLKAYKNKTIKGLYRLQKNHGVVPHPYEPKV